MMPRKFRVLQIGGDDLEPIFQHKKGVSWDYFDIGLFEFDSGYVEAIEAIVEAEGRFDFIYIRTILGDINEFIPNDKRTIQYVC